MGLQVMSKINKVDDEIGGLVKQRRGYSDPIDILQTSESIDELLDDRLRLMHVRDGQADRTDRASERSATR